MAYSKKCSTGVPVSNSCLTLRTESNNETSRSFRSLNKMMTDEGISIDLIFFTHIYNMGGKSSTQMVLFFTWSLPITFTFSSDVRSRLVKKIEKPKMFVWTRKMQFWQRCRRFFLNVGKFFSQSPIITMKSWFFFKKTLPQKFIWKRKMQFLQPYRNFLAKIRKFFVQSPKIITKTNIFPQNSSGQVESNSDNPARNFFAKNLKIFSSNLEYNYKEWSFCKKFRFPQNGLMDT